MPVSFFVSYSYTKYESISLGCTIVHLTKKPETFDDLTQITTMIKLNNEKLRDKTVVLAHIRELDINLDNTPPTMDGDIQPRNHSARLWFWDESTKTVRTNKQRSRHTAPDGTHPTTRHSKPLYN